MGNYRSTVVPVADLSSDDIGRMAGLYLANYEASSVALFTGDLAEKDEAILLYRGDELVGFTTLLVYAAPLPERAARIVYSGDTIVRPADWGQQELAFAWLRRIGEIKAQAPDLPLYWLLLVKGHRTFKYLSVFSKSFHPHWACERPDLKALAEQLARARFGAHFRADRGIVAFPQSRGQLVAAIATPSPEECSKPGTRFFLDKNPDYRSGHELVCLCELDQSNMKPLAARIFAGAFKQALAA
ncbi:MAG: hypothetical protein D3M94_07595 [Rhodocyclales bacterium GT-UBC]|nr:MAG: hypothetical protein D3M94_07595 [Rhodocyclales bacterium GT-UBC]